MFVKDTAARFKPMAYYAPTQEDSEQTESAAHTFSFTAPPEPGRIQSRILGRRYGLTSTWYKYLDIGIAVGPVACVDIVIGDNRNTRLTLSYPLWKEMMQRRADIDRLLYSPASSPVWIRDLLIESTLFKNVLVAKFSICGNILFMKRETVDALFTFNLCIDQMYFWLCESINFVNTKFNKFVNVLQDKNITENSSSSRHTVWRSAAQVIRESDDFDCSSLIDCELLACALQDIVCEATAK